MAFIISHKYRFIYVHIPKTGGTSICYLKGNGLGCLDLLLGKEDEALPHQHAVRARGYDYPVWCSIREPYDRAVSMYHNCAKRYGWKSFDDFCHTLKSEYMFYLTNILWPQAWYITDEDTGEMLASHFILFDQMYDGVKRLFGSIGIGSPKRLPHLQDGRDHGRVSGGRLFPEDLDEYYTDGSREVIRNIYRADFELYNNIRKTWGGVK